jgi:hypothetical protein
MLFSPAYQGNAGWAGFGLFSLFLLAQVLLGARRRRNAGRPVDTRDTLRGCIVCLLFFAVAMYQVLSHQ